MKRSDVMSQPAAMKTDRYIGMGLAYVDGNAAWDLMRACVDGDLDVVERLVAGDSNLVNVQYWYQIPLHFAVREGHVEIVRHLIENGADPASTCYGCGAWRDLLDVANVRGLADVKALLEAAMIERFSYSAAFEPLAAAIRSYDRGRIEHLLDEKPELLEASDDHGNGVAHWAVLTQQPDLLGPLRSRGVDLDARRADGRTPALLAIHGDYHFRAWRDVPADRRRTPMDLVDALLENGAERRLSVAVCQGDVDHVRPLLEAEPSLAGTLDRAHTSPLCYASLGGHAGMTELLLSFGPDPNQPEMLAPRGRALFEAAARNDVEQATLLLDAGADPDAEVDSSGNCLYIVAARYPDECAAMLELLRSRGARQATCQMSREELAAALEAGEIDTDAFLSADVLEKADPALVDRLLERDGDFARKLDGWSFRASANHLVTRRDVLDRLADAGLDVNRGDWSGRTLLHYCAEYGDAGTAAWCLDHGADVGAVELFHGGTPLATAARCGQLEVAELLLARGADPSVPSGLPWAVPVAQARRAGHHEMVRLLGRTGN